MRILRFVALFLLACLAVPAGVVSGVAAAAPTTLTWAGVGAPHHPGFDRIVYEFRGGPPPSHRVRYVRPADR